MRIILGFEHVRRLVGSHSQIVTELGLGLTGLGHDVTIVCDTVLDPMLWPDLHFVARRTFRIGESRRPGLLRTWASSVIPELGADISLSFTTAIPGDLLCPILGSTERRIAGHGRFMERLRGRISPRKRALTRTDAQTRSDRRVRGVIALSETMAEEIREAMPWFANRIIHIPGASPIHVPSESERAALRLQGRRMLRIAPEEVFFLWCSKQPGAHGLIRLLEALADLRREDPAAARAVLVLAGEGQWEAASAAARLGIDDAVRIIGRTAALDLLLSAADVAVSPALYSTLGRATWEALAFGVPLLISDRSGGSDRVRESGAGVIVPARDVGALARGLGDLIDDRRRAAFTIAAATIAPDLRFERLTADIERALRHYTASPTTHTAQNGAERHSWTNA